MPPPLRIGMVILGTAPFPPTTAYNSGLDVGYVYTPDRLNRSSMSVNGAVTNYTANGLNQYVSVGEQSPTYDANFNLETFNGLTADYDASNRLMTASKSGITAQFVYDGMDVV